jgi:hypothetical protein
MGPELPAPPEDPPDEPPEDPPDEPPEDPPDEPPEDPPDEPPGIPPPDEPPGIPPPDEPPGIPPPPGMPPPGRLTPPPPEPPLLPPLMPTDAHAVTSNAAEKATQALANDVRDRQWWIGFIILGLSGLQPRSSGQRGCAYSSANHQLERESALMFRSDDYKVTIIRDPGPINT